MAGAYFGGNYFGQYGAGESATFGAVTLPSLTASGSGALEQSGSGAATLPSLEAFGVSGITAASGSPSLPSLVALGSAGQSIMVDGSGAVTLPALTSAGAASKPVESGLTGAIIHRPDLSAVPNFPGPLQVFGWKTSRYQNAVGKWSATIAVDDQTIPDPESPYLERVPVQRQIERGWRVSLIQENNIPLNGVAEGHLLYKGIVEQREYVPGESGTARLELSGSFRNLTLAGNATRRGLSFTGTIAETAETLVGGDVYIGSPGGIILPPEAAEHSPQIEYSDRSRLSALLYLGEVSRLAYRESWDHDRPEFTLIDGPEGFYQIINVGEANPDLDRMAREGFAIIGNPQNLKIRFEGQEILNRIIPLGVDANDEDLTLEFTTRTAPFSVISDVNPDGTPLFYIEDNESILRYGLFEQTIVRTDVKNPSDSPITREKTANVLYDIAAGELLRRRSENIFVTVPIANGAAVWALPGDVMRFTYTGWVQLEPESQSFAALRRARVVWIDIDRLFIVAERHDMGDPSGVRQVEFVLAAPSMEYPIADLPDAIRSPAVSLPPISPMPFPPLPLPPRPTYTFEITSPCCPDPTVTITEDSVPIPEEDEEGEEEAAPPNPIRYLGSGGARSKVLEDDSFEFHIQNTTEDTIRVFVLCKLEQFQDDWLPYVPMPPPPDGLPAEPTITNTSGSVSWSTSSNLILDGNARITIWSGLLPPDDEADVNVAFVAPLSHADVRMFQVNTYTNIDSTVIGVESSASWDVDKSSGPAVDDLVLVLVEQSNHYLGTREPYDALTPIEWENAKKAIAYPRVFYGLGPRIIEFEYPNGLPQETAVWEWVLSE